MEIEEIEITELPRSPDDRRKIVRPFTLHPKPNRRKKQRRKPVSN